MLTLIGKTPDGRDIYRDADGKEREQTAAELARENARFAEMLARRQAPGVRTDSTQFAGRMGRQFADSPEQGDWLARRLRAAGGSPAGKVYLSGLADTPGDPKAWVSDSSDIRRVCEERGLGCTGEVTVKKPEFGDPVPTIPLAPHIVTREVRHVLAKNPEVAPTPADKARLWSDTYEKRLPPKYRDSGKYTAPEPPKDL